MSRKRCGRGGRRRARGADEDARSAVGPPDTDLSGRIPPSSSGLLPPSDAETRRVPCGVRMPERNIPLPENRSIV
ncbi:predicted protein [Streptomyces viridosporus ATCC 14672]|uniref:Predicted protein n=1 Tax=Streptomyces viridosporus (strain ATCC 14672 / DSM 40746 / JCM 4963 / KCTC 9882 / NRRL B-12104 / FH 1290) TaxID=566461 RepID=D6A9Q5_STRV1|nr:predicted protein [Streptomyces viridosporus ATCC 14672]